MERNEPGIVNGQVKRYTPGRFFLFLTFLVTWLVSTPAHAQGEPQVSPAPAPKRVLLLYTYGDGLPAYQKANPAFLSAMSAGGINLNDLFFEYLDLQRHNGAEYRQRLAELLRYKYAEGNADLMIAVHTEALYFLLDEGKGLFPDAPVFSYLVARPELIEAKNTGRRILQRPQGLDMKGTLEIALKMFPKTRKIVFITGPAEHRLEHEAKRVFEPWRNKLEFEYTSDRSVEEILQSVASLPPRSIVIYGNVFSDKTGRTFIPLDIEKMVARAANAPVFCLWDTLIGHGPIGGSLLSFEAEGASAAKEVLGLLNGKTVLTKPVTTLPTSRTYMFDRQQLRRWRVDEALLPEGSVLVNHVPTLWEQHKGLVIGSIAAFLAQTLLVSGLLIQRNLKKKAELSVRRKTEELDQFFNVSLDLLCIANTEGFFLRLNPMWEEVLGYTRDELMARPFQDFVHPDDLLKTREAVSVQVSEQRVTRFENRYRCKDGTYRWLEWNSVPAGNLIYAAARDITERKEASTERIRLRNELAHVQRVSSIGELSSVLAHELNQPLGAILNNASAAQILSSKLKGGDTEFGEILADIISDATHAGEVIRKIRGIVKRGETNFEPLNLNVLIEEVVELYRNFFNAQNVLIFLDLQPDLLPARGVRVHLQQVLMNLMNNASEALSESPSKTLKIRSSLQSPGMIIVSVSDSGKGIDEAKKEIVFESFFTTKKDGLGMGLRICRSIIEQHGGRIWVENNPGGGATFFFSLQEYGGSSG